MADWIGYIYEQDLNKLFTLTHSPKQEYRLITTNTGYIYPKTFIGVFKLSFHLFSILIKDYFNPINPNQLKPSLKYQTITNYIKI